MALIKITNDDIFISYCRSDAKTYTDGLANELTKKGFSCFTDALGSDSGEKIPESLIRKLKSCMMLVIVGSKDASRSEAVANEIEVFSLTKGTSAIIPIDFNNSMLTANWKNFVIGLRREEEQQDALITGNPSPSIVNRIEKAFVYRKSKDRLKVYTLSAATILGILIIGILGAAFIANKQFQKAADANILADEATALAKSQTEIAAIQTQIAEEATSLAKISEGNAAEALKNKHIADIQFKIASEKALSATAQAEMQQKIASSIQYANESQTLLLEPKLITASIEKAIQSTELIRSIGKYSVNSDAALRSSLSFLADFKYREVFPDKKLLFNSGGEIIEVKSSDSTKHFYRAGESTPFFQLEINYKFMGDPYTSFSVSKDCNYIAFGSGKLLTVINTVDKSSVYYEYSEDSEKSVSKIALSPNGKYLIVSTNYDSHTDFTEIWDIARDSLVDLHTTSATTVNSISFSPNGTSLVMGCTDINLEGNFINVAYVWNLDFNSDDIVNHYSFSNPVIVEHENLVGGVSAGLDNTSFASWQDSISIVWKLGSRNSYNPVSYILTSEAISDLAFKSGSEELLIIGSKDPYSVEEVGNSVETWNYGGYEQTSQYFLPFLIEKTGFEGQSKNLIGLVRHSNLEDFELIFWQNKKNSGLVQKPITIQSETIRFLSEDLSTTITFNDSLNTLNIWNYSIKENTIYTDNSLISFNFTITPDRHWISWIQIGKDGKNKVIIMKLSGENYGLISTFPIVPNISEMKFTPNGNQLILMDENNSFLIWDNLIKAFKTGSFFEEPEPIQSFNLSPRGNYISTVNYTYNTDTYRDEYILNIWDFKSFRKLASFNKLTGIDHYAWSEDEQNILMSCYDNYILLELEKSKITTIEIPTFGYGPFNVFSFSPSGKYFAVVGEKGIVRIFETSSCEEVSRLSPTGIVRSIAFRSDDQYMVTVSENRSFFSVIEDKMTSLNLWQIMPDGLIMEAKRRLNKIKKK